MTKKLIGTEYQIEFQGTWEQVAQTMRETKEAIKETQTDVFSSRDLFETEFIKLENKILRGYIVPQEEESFKEYRSRFFQTYLGTGFKGKLALLLLGKKVPCNFSVSYDDSDLFKLNNVVLETEYRMKIAGTGVFEKRAESIANLFKELFEENDVKYTYNTIDRFI